MATEFCQNCKQSHPGRVCDYDAQGECAETMGVEDGAAPCETEPSKMRRITRPSDPRHRQLVPSWFKPEHDLAGHRALTKGE